MDIENLSRRQKEDLYKKEIEKLIDPQFLGNSDEWKLSEWTDDELENKLEEIDQLKFENKILFIKNFFKFLIIIFIALGVLGLLIFGIRQIF